MRATKEVAFRGQQLPFLDAIRFGETMRRVAGSLDDVQEGRDAYHEKRPAPMAGPLGPLSSYSFAR